MKKFIAGFIIGAVFFGSFAYAAENYSIAQNAFPIFVNGTEKNVEALNINGTTWMRLGSVGQVLGIDVNFDEVNKKINIGVGGDSAVIDNGKTNDWRSIIADEEEEGQKRLQNELGNTKPRYYTENGAEMMEYGKKTYISLSSATDYIEEKTGGRISVETFLRDHGAITNMNDISGILVSERQWIEYTYYTNTILPLIQ